jgi:hypothetical protein
MLFKIKEEKIQISNPEFANPKISMKFSIDCQDFINSETLSNINFKNADSGFFV